jgi:asparagine synthase (glutamine-hydrolysing)
LCGICGEWNIHGVDAASLERMNASLTHRGPDDQGAVLLGEAGLAMRRLSIIDLARGHQPIANEDGSIWIVFNGEIYNHRELRRELVSRGHFFRTESDTEVILHLYEDRGERVVEELRGMFAFAIWDTRRRKLLLARDRFGQKPLFYRFDGRRFLFSSEIKAILAAAGPDAPRPELDLRSLDEYLTLRFIPSPRTLFQGIRPRTSSPSTPPRSSRGPAACPARPASRSSATGACATAPSGGTAKPTWWRRPATASARRWSPT